MTGVDEELEYRPSRLKRVAPGLIAVGLLGATALWIWPYYTAWRAWPDRWVEGVSAGVDLNQLQLTAPDHHDYAYGFSPLIRQLDLEQAWLDADTAPIRALAAHIAEAVAWEMVLASGEADIRNAERVLWERGQQEEPLAWIAAELRLAGVIYGEEELFTHGFDPEANAGNFVHLDCDLISHVFTDVGMRLDLDIREMNSPLHAYLAYFPPEGLEAEALYAEPTEFRSQIHYEDGSIDLRGWDLGELFWITRTFHQVYARSAKASPTLTEAAGFYTEKTDRDLEDMIVDSVAVGLLERIDRERFPSERTPEVLELMRARLDGTREPHLVNNFATSAVRWGWTLLGQGDIDGALALSEEVIALRASHASLFLTGQPLELGLKAWALHEAGREEELEATLVELEEIYRYPRRWGNAVYAWDHTHAQLLWLRALQRPPDLDALNELLLPVLNLLQDSVGHDPLWEADVYDRSAEALRSTDPAQARIWHARARQLRAAE